MNERVSGTSVTAAPDIAAPAQVLKAFVNRQPIFDAQRHVHAYTLLHQSPAPRQYESDEQHHNTPVLICYAFMETGIEALVGPHRVALYLTRGLLLMDYARSYPKSA